MHCFSEAVAAATFLAGDADEVFKDGAGALLHPAASGRVHDFFIDNTDDFLQQLTGLADTEPAAVGAAEAFGEHPFQEPRTRPPMRESGLLHCVQRAELGVHFGATELFFELGVPLGFAVNGVVTTLYAAGRFADAQAGGNKRTDFTASGVIQSARPAATAWFCWRGGVSNGMVAGPVAAV